MSATHLPSVRALNTVLFLARLEIELNRCCTNLSRLEHCPLCSQEETIDHLLVSCVFSHQAWFIVLQCFGLQHLAPQPNEQSFEDWWEVASTRAVDYMNQGLNSLVILVAWAIWNHRNRCVFEGRQPDLVGLITSIREDLNSWGYAGARGI
jgi:hypothetical protein